MAVYISDQNTATFIHESGTYANKSGNGVWLGQVQSVDVDENVNVISSRYAGTASRNVGAFIDGPLDVTATLGFFVQDFRMLGFAMGSIVDSGSPSPYAHTLNEVNSNNGNAYTSGTQNPFLSFTLQTAQQSPGGDGTHFVRELRGCNVNSYTLTANEGEPLTAEVELVAQNVVFSSGTPTSVTEDTNRVYLWQDAVLHIPSGTTLETPKNIRFSVNNNLEANHYVNGSRVIGVPIPTMRDYELEVTANLMSEVAKTWYDQYFLGGSTFNAMLSVVASAGSRQAFIIMSGCKMEDMTATNNNEGAPNEVTLMIRPRVVNAVVDDLIFRYNAW